ncbi:Ig-like domain-containing protein [Sodalis sp. dw_96]|uniref:Ig-like domain-containing protein n=1 Tax=Sodalis sp. dw_96 TaxID=2719794 RepID=UPI001BD5D1EB|nr:Ig-like domain-containing protein [Sodalis sp. dw_96]
MPSAYPCTQPLAGLAPPLVPQVFNGVIHTIQIDLAGGLYIQVPPYPDQAINDIIHVFLSDVEYPVVSFIIQTLPGLPRTFLIPPSLVTVGPYFTFYAAIDESGNQAASPRVDFNIVQSARVNNFLAITIINNGATADGVSENLVKATLYNPMLIPVAGELLQISVSGPAQYPSIITTDASGAAYIPITSTVAGPMTVTASLASDPTISISTQIEFQAFNQSVCR